MKRPLCCVCMAFAAAFAAAVSIYLFAGLLPEDDVGQIEGSNLTLIGEVYNKEYKNDSLTLYLRHVKNINQKSDRNDEKISEQKTEYHDTRVMCYMDSSDISPENEPKCGARIAVSGEASLFSQARNPGEFDAKTYYRTLGISFRLFDAKIIKASSSYSAYHEDLYRLRRFFEGIYDKTLSENDAAVLKAMALGNKTQLDAKDKQLFQRSGISHILAISGLHISLIGMFFYSILKKTGMPRVLSSFLCTALMIAYGDMVGMSGSAYRAVFMFGMKLLAEALGRTYDMMTALSLAAAFLLAEQPLYIYQAGFWLSFGAVFGIGAFSDMVKPDVENIKNKTLRQTLLALSGSLSIFLVHFPLLLCFYYEFPVYSFLLNLIVIPAMGALLALALLCLLCGSLGGVFFGVAKLAGLLCHLIIAFFEGAGRISLKLPLSQWIAGKPDNWKIAVFYLLVLALWLIHQYGKKVSKGKRASALNMRIALPYWYKLAFIAIAVTFLSRHRISGTNIAFLDVGQGDGIWIESASGKHYLIDGGSTSKSKIGQYTLMPYLKYMGAPKLDAIFLTHLDEDHISGVYELLESCEGKSGASGITIDRIIISKAVIKDGAYETLKMLCEKNDIPLLYAKAGDVIGDETLSFEVLHPDEGYAPESKNAYSLVMRLIVKGKEQQFAALFTGDVEADGEEKAAEYLEKKCGDAHMDLYKAAHHGSKYSNTETIIDVAKPALTVISCGEKNRYGHPHKEAVENFEKAGSQIAITKDTGAVTVRIRKGEWEVEYYLD